MADFDKDSFVTIGTAFDIPEEDAPKKKALPVHEQFATDKEGRRRFHGAFTGGFSAGYFNTVGSKEGWTPSTFISSRSKRSETSRQQPEDFMDDDDLGDHGIAPRNVETTKLFAREKDALQKQGTSAESQSGSGLDSMVRGVLEDMVIVPCRMSIGVTLLKKMGWKEGQGIGPRVRQVQKRKVYGCMFPSRAREEEHDIYADGLLFAPKDTKPFTFVPKDNLHGIGYKGMVTHTVTLNLSKPGYAGNLKIKGQAFGVGAFEEDDDDVYSHDAMSNYDIEISDKKALDSHSYGWTGPPIQSNTGGALSAFSKAAKARAPNKVYPPPKIPSGYQPFASQKQSEDVESREQPEKVGRARSQLTSDERGKLLGEKPLPKTVKSVFDYMDKSDKDRIVSAKSATGASVVKIPPVNTRFHSPTGTVGTSGFQPFAKDPRKQARYNHFLECRKNGKEFDLPKELCSSLTEWEREREKDEFFRSAVIFQPIKGSMASRFTAGGSIDDENNERFLEQPVTSSEEKAAKMKMFGKLTRSTLEWHPAKLLCKRFNIPEPYPSSKTIGVVEQKNEKEKFNLGNLFASSTQKNEAKTNSTPGRNTTTPQLALPEPENSTMKEESGDMEQSSTNSKAEANASLNVISEQRITEKPSMDLFKAIFASSSEESEESQPEDEDIATETQPTTSTSVSGVKTDIAKDSDQMPSESTAAVSNISYPRNTESSPDQESRIITEANTENNITQNDVLGCDKLEYGPRPPPRSLVTKPDDVGDAPAPSVLSSRRSVPFSDSTSESESEVSHKKSKKRKHKRKHKKKQKEKDGRDHLSARESAVKLERSNRKGDDKKTEKSDSLRTLPSDKEILSKLKSVKHKRRMCAADFM